MGFYDNKKEYDVKMRIEFESTPIRHIAIECPECKAWFMGHDFTKEHIGYDYQLYMMDCECPKCGAEFTIKKPVVEEVGHPEVYKDCMMVETETVKTFKPVMG